jgi:hypothetical protein
MNKAHADDESSPEQAEHEKSSPDMSLHDKCSPEKFSDTNAKMRIKKQNRERERQQLIEAEQRMINENSGDAEVVLKAIVQPGVVVTNRSKSASCTLGTDYLLLIL